MSSLWKQEVIFFDIWPASSLNRTLTLTGGPLDYGQYYAARSGSGKVQSGSGRRVLFSATGWHNPPGLKLGPDCATQMHLIPRDLSLDSKNRLIISPIPELASLREEDERDTTNGTSGSSVELRMNCTVGGTPSGMLGFDILSTEDRTSFVRVGYDLSKKMLVVDHSHGGGPDSKIIQTAPLTLDAHEDVELIILVDGALTEVFVNRRTVLSSFSTHVFDATQSPEERWSYPLQPPAGVSCVHNAWSLKKPG